jgi:hypothetical protein
MLMSDIGREVKYMYWFTGILGLLFIGAPFVAGYSNNQAALWTSLLVGAGLVLASALEAMERDKDPLEYWATILLGAVAIVAPYILRYDAISNALWASLSVGVLVMIGAVGRLLVSPQTSYGRAT